MTERLPTWRLAAFASIAFPGAGMTLPLAIFLPPFYTRTLGLGLAEVGMVFILVRIFDIVTDPIMGLNAFAGICGSLLILVPLAMLEYHGAAPAGRDALDFFGTMVLLLAPLCIVAAVTLVGERPTAPTPRIGLQAGVAAVLRNTHMRRLLLADAMASMPGSVMAGLFIFYQAELLGDAHFNSVALITFFAAHLLGVPVWVRLSYRIGKHRTFAWESLLFCVTTSLFFIPGKGNVWLFIVFMFATGFAYSGLQFLIRAMTADVVDYDHLETGGQRTGLYFALVAITGKLGGALAIGVSYPLLAEVGFDAHGHNSEEVLASFRLIYVLVPVLAMLAAYLGIRGFSLDHAAQIALQTQLEERRSTLTPPVRRAR